MITRSRFYTAGNIMHNTEESITTKVYSKDEGVYRRDRQGYKIKSGSV